MFESLPKAQVKCEPMYHMTIQLGLPPPPISSSADHVIDAASR